jgi:septal ring factor EnvC (AmiA/AmiB activator)
MEAEAIYYELNKQLENIVSRLTKIEEKIDGQAEKDHYHELKIQKLETAIENIRTEMQEEKTTIKKLQEKVIDDLDRLFTKMRDIEQIPDKKKAGLVNTVIDRAFNYLLGIILAGIVAYLTIKLGIK